MHWVWDSQKKRDYAILTKPPSSQATKPLAAGTRSYKPHKKGPEWNNAAYEVKKFFYHFAHSAQGSTNSHPISIKGKE